MLRSQFTACESRCTPSWWATASARPSGAPSRRTGPGTAVTSARQDGSCGSSGSHPPPPLTSSPPRLPCCEQRGTLRMLVEPVGDVPAARRDRRPTPRVDIVHREGDQLAGIAVAAVLRDRHRVVHHGARALVAILEHADHFAVDPHRVSVRVGLVRELRTHASTLRRQGACHRQTGSFPGRTAILVSNSRARSGQVVAADRIAAMTRCPTRGADRQTSRIFGIAWHDCAGPRRSRGIPCPVSLFFPPIRRPDAVWRRSLWRSPLRWSAPKAPVRASCAPWTSTTPPPSR